MWYLRFIVLLYHQSDSCPRSKLPEQNAEDWRGLVVLDTQYEMALFLAIHGYLLTRAMHAQNTGLGPVAAPDLRAHTSGLAAA